MTIRAVPFEPSAGSHFVFEPPEPGAYGPAVEVLTLVVTDPTLRAEREELESKVTSAAIALGLAAKARWPDAAVTTRNGGTASVLVERLR